MKKDFEKWLGDFKVSISNYAYYVDFEKVYKNVKRVKSELDKLGTLVGCKDIKNKFVELVKANPSIIKSIPLLLAVREKQIYINDEDKFIDFVFNESLDVNLLAEFMEKSGLFDLIQNNVSSSLIDYVVGVEVGLDSNGRKNRGGHLMEDVVEKYLVDAGFVKGETYFKEMYLRDIEKKWGLNLSALSNNGKASKRFDFVVKTGDCVYAIETNFYGGNGGGSKLNETARSYKMLAQEAENIDGFKFVWVTDGTAWRSARRNLEETFDVLDTIYNIKELEEGSFKKLMI